MYHSDNQSNTKIDYSRYFLFLAEEQVDGRAMHVPVLADFVLQIALVGILDPLRQVAEKDKRGHMGTLEHGDVLDLDVLALDSGGRVGLNGLLQHIVEL